MQKKEILIKTWIYNSSRGSVSQPHMGRHILLMGFSCLKQIKLAQIEKPHKEMKIPQQEFASGMD